MTQPGQQERQNTDWWYWIGYSYGAHKIDLHNTLPLVRDLRSDKKMAFIMGKEDGEGDRDAYEDN